MLFSSIDFAIFLPVVFVLYWFGAGESLRRRNALLVLASYVFYGWWDWRFLILIFLSSLADYLVGIGLSGQENEKTRRLLLFASMGANLAFLGFFKYFNFFMENFARAFSFLGVGINAPHLAVILPVGISFYTFQTMSYSIDVYRKKLEATKDFVSFAAFVSFFPQLVAGPIERAANLLPQFRRERRFDYGSAVDGCRQMLWGFFKKIVIADSCAGYVDAIFGNYQDYGSATLALGAALFAVQIYGDFSGYSDIAIGVAKLFGFTLSRNFAFPYFSRDVAEFWRRWHISLTTWFRDYVYIPLGGSRGGVAMSARNTLAVFLISGLWHGAKWTFVLWGLINALWFLPLLLLKRNRENLDVVAAGRMLPSPGELFSIASTFCLTTFAWIFFRSESVPDALSYIARIFTGPFFSASAPPLNKFAVVQAAMLAFFAAAEWLGRENRYAIERLDVGKGFRRALYYGVLGVILLFSGTPQTFIYFQF